MAQNHIDSAVASILNSLTPPSNGCGGNINVSYPKLKRQILGVFVGLIGTLLLILAGADFNPNPAVFL